MPNAYAFTERTAQTLVRLARDVPGGPPPKPTKIAGADRSYFAKTTAAIPARSGNTPGTGTVNVWLYDAATTALTIWTNRNQFPAVTVDVLNPHSAAIPADTFVQTVRDAFANHWVTWFPPYKPTILFTNDAAFTTASASFAGTTQEQHGHGIDNPTTAVTIYNRRVKAAATYQYHSNGTTGRYGVALWRDGNNYQLIDFDCP